jgi:hypothetical protein
LVEQEGLHNATFLTLDSVVVWLPMPGADLSLPPQPLLIGSSADLPEAHFIDLVATVDRLRVDCRWDARQTLPRFAARRTLRWDLELAAFREAARGDYPQLFLPSAVYRPPRL